VSATLITAEDVAGMLGVSVGWVYAEVRAGRVSHVRLGRSVRFRPAAIEEWLRELEAATLAPTAKRGQHRANGLAPTPKG